MGVEDTRHGMMAIRHTNHPTKAIDSFPKSRYAVCRANLLHASQPRAPAASSPPASTAAAAVWRAPTATRQQPGNDRR
jgi:hypothetical protein